MTYLKAQADAEGFGTEVVREIEQRIAQVASTDGWLAGHPPRIEWEADLPPAELEGDDPIVTCALGCVEAVGRQGVAAGMNSWHDAATFTRAGIPTIDLGPSGFGSAHAIDERVAVDDLVACAQAYALCAMRFTAASASPQAASHTATASPPTTSQTVTASPQTASPAATDSRAR